MFFRQMLSCDDRCLKFLLGRWDNRQIVSPREYLSSKPLFLPRRRLWVP